MTASVIYGFHMSELEDLLLAGDHDTDIDLEASTSNYLAAIEKALTDAFPGATVDIRYDRHTVGSLPADLKPRYLDPDGNEDDDRVIDIFAVVESVVDNYESWIVLNG